MNGIPENARVIYSHQPGVLLADYPVSRKFR
jgi:hypothetical protein